MTEAPTAALAKAAPPAAARDAEVEGRLPPGAVPSAPPAWTGPAHLALGLAVLGWLPVGVLLVHRDPWWAAAVVPVSTFALTTLFILAHEAIHGRFWPGRPRVDAAAGTVAAFAFVFMSYRRLRAGHVHHHRVPGTDGDPDYHASGRYLRHLARFVGRYVSVWQLLAIAAFNTLAGQFGWSGALVWGWYLPAVGATLLLFTFGVYLVHHPGLAATGRLCPVHRAAGLRLPAWLGLVTVLFFNVHWLHHAAPWLAWFQLARYRHLERHQVGFGEAVAAARAFGRAGAGGRAGRAGPADSA